MGADIDVSSNGRSESADPSDAIPGPAGPARQRRRPGGGRDDTRAGIARRLEQRRAREEALMVAAADALARRRAAQKAAEEAAEEIATSVAALFDMGYREEELISLLEATPAELTAGQAPPAVRTRRG